MVGAAREPAELEQRRREAQEAHRTRATRRSRATAQAGCALQHADHQRYARADAPCAVLLPVLLLAEMPAVVGPEHDDGVVAVRARVERVEHAAEHRVRECDRGEVALDRLAPLPVLADVREVAVRSAPLARRRQVVEVVRLVARRQLDRFERKEIEVLLRHEPGLVRAVEAAREEEGLFVCARELLADPVADQIVAAEFLVVDIERAPVRLDVLPRARAREVDRARFRIERARQGAFALLRGEVVVPGRRVDEVVEEFSRACGPIASPREAARKQLRCRHDVAHLLPVCVEPAAPRRDAGQDCRTRRVARGRGAVRVGKEHARRREAIEVRRARLRVPAEAADPVVEVIDGDEEHVRRALVIVRGLRSDAEGEREEGSERDGELHLESVAP